MHNNVLRPSYSKPWFGRRFIIDNCALRWGRYEIANVDFAKIFSTDMLDMRAKIRDIEPDKIAIVFEDLIHTYIPSTLPSYLLEVDALATLEFAKLHPSAVKAQTCMDTYMSARAAIAAAFEAALAAVFQAALPLHELDGLSFVRYRQMLHGMHLADFTGNNLMYQVAFTPDLILECVDKVSTWERVWPLQIEKGCC